jgi:hypothetical protein
MPDISSLHESVARWLRDRYPAWTLIPEASFAFFSDRGVIDLLGWHSGRRAALVVELKTEIVDMNELLGTLDRKRRVAPKVATERGWDPVTLAAWLVVAASRTNRRRIEAHNAMIRGALPDGGPAMRRWLADPVGRVGAVSFWSETVGSGARLNGPVRRSRSD